MAKREDSRPRPSRERGCGAVVVVLTEAGHQSVKIAKDASIRTTSRLFRSRARAFGDALKKSRELAAQRRGGVTAGLKIPGM